MVKCLRYFLIPFLVFGAYHFTKAQSYSFTSGPIPMCDTSVFTANVWGFGQLGYDPWSGSYTYLDQLCINITSDHPQTLVITLTSPQGTNLLLSAYNGAGGSNYTNTCFTNFGAPITSGTAPFTGSWMPQGGNFYIFDGEWGSGIWTITVIDTACSSGGGGSGGTWTPGYFNGSGSGGFNFGYNPPPPCWNFWFPTEYINICPDDTIVDLTNYIWWLTGYNINIYDPNGQPVTDPTAVTLTGTYYVDINDPWNGCSTSTNIYISVLPQAALGPNQNISICSGSTINLNTLFPLTGFSKSWSFNGSYISNTLASNASTPGVYQVIAYNSAGCNDTALVTLTNSPGVSLGANQTINSCGTASLDLTSLYNTSGLTANWSLNGNFISNPSAINNSGIYTLIASNANGCSDTAQVNFIIIATPSLGPDQMLNLCSGESVNLTVLFSTGTFPTNWYFNGNSVLTPNSVDLAGTYMLIASGSMSCADTAFVTINTIPTPALGPDQSISICSNSPVDLTSLYITSGYNTSWTINGNSVANPASINSSGSYILIASAPSGCADTAEVIINSSPSPALGQDQNINFCDAYSIDLTNLYSTSGLISNWLLNGNLITNPASVNVSGNYILIATDLNGCSDTAEVSLSALSSPVLGPDQTVNICFNLPFDLTSLFNTSGYSTTWSLNGNIIGNPTNVNTSGAYILITTATNGCSDTAEVNVTSSTAPMLGPDQNINMCSGDSVNLTTLYNTNGVNSSWTTGGVAVNNPISITSTGNYQLIVSSTSGCSDTAIVTVNINALPVLGPDISINACSNTSVDLTSIFNTTGFNITWSSNGILVTNPNNISASGIYTINALNSSGCSASADVTVVVNSSPALGNDENISLCAGNSIDLTSIFATMGLSTNWTTGVSTVSDPTTINSAGNYQLIATNTFGCSDTALVIVTVNDLPLIGAAQSLDLCSWMTVDLGSIYNLSGFNTTYFYNNQPILNYNSVSDSGIYIVEVTDNNGCSNTTSVYISNIYCECNADFEYTGYCSEDPFNFKIIADSAITDVHWQFGSSNIPDNYSLHPSVYFTAGENTVENNTVTLDINLSCGNIIIKKEIQVSDCSCPVYLPTSFTPNRDGLNDLFGWQTDCQPESYLMEIYNRFGQVIFHSKNPEIKWNGLFENEEIPIGLYIVKVDYKMPYGKKEQLINQLWVIR